MQFDGGDMDSNTKQLQQVRNSAGFDLMAFGLGLQAAERRQQLSSQSYRAPIERICDSCGRKHTGRFETCASCAGQP